MSWITFHHLVGWFKASIGDFSDGQLFVVSLLGRDNRGISYQWEMDTGIWHQISLEFSKINIESTIKPKGGGDGGNNLANESVKIGVGWSFNIQVPSADIIDSFIINHESTIGMFKGCMGSQDSVIGLNHSGCYLRGWVDGELKLGLFTVIHGQTLHEKRCKSRSSSTAEGVKDQEAYKHQI